jgi:hypothetical protein
LAGSHPKTGSFLGLQQPSTTHSKKGEMMIAATRRDFLARGSLATLGGAITIGGGWHLASAATFEDQLDAVLVSSNANQVRQLMANLATDPALAALAQTILQNNGTSLTSFQQNLIQGLLTTVPYSAALYALISGTPLTQSQRVALNQLKGKLLANPAVQKLISAGAQLKGGNNADQLQLYVNQAIAGDTVALRTPTTLGNAQLDAVVADIFAVQASTAFRGFISAIVPLLQSPNFLPFLQTQDPLLVASFIPGNVLIAFLLPGDKDPFTPAVVNAVLNVIGTILLTIVLFATLPATVSATIVTLAIIGSAAIIASAFIGLYTALDCDFDGDPLDPADVPGNECPA